MVFLGSFYFFQFAIRPEHQLLLLLALLNKNLEVRRVFFLAKDDAFNPLHRPTGIRGILERFLNVLGNSAEFDLGLFREDLPKSNSALFPSTFRKRSRIPRMP